MTMFEDRLQVALHDLAEDTGPAPLARWAARVPSHPAPRARVLALPLVAAAVVVTLLVVAVVVVVRREPPSVVEPVDQPPRVVRVSGTTSAAPGRSVLAFTLGHLGDGSTSPTGYLVAGSEGSGGSGGSEGAVALPEEQLVQPVANYARPQMSADGHYFLVQVVRQPANDHSGRPPEMTLVDLETGRRDRLGGAAGFCPELSPDSRSVAFLAGTGVRVLDVSSRDSRPVSTEVRPDAVTGCAGGIGWSPDRRTLAVGRPAHLGSGDVDSTRVVTLDGRTVRDLRGHLVNGSMSWSPDGAALLLYTPQTGRYTVGRPDGSPPTSVTAPADAVGAVGWAGSRVVWLLGGAGAQRLVTTDVEGGDVRPWTVLDVGERPLVSIQWSRDLAGTAAR